MHFLVTSRAMLERRSRVGKQYCQASGRKAAGSKQAASSQLVEGKSRIRWQLAEWSRAGAQSKWRRGAGAQVCDRELSRQSQRLAPDRFTRENPEFARSWFRLRRVLLS